MPSINHKRKTSKKSKSSKRSKNTNRNKKTRSNMRKMKGGAGNIYMIYKGEVIEAPEEYLLEFNKIDKTETTQDILFRLVIDDVYILTTNESPEHFLQDKYNARLDFSNGKTFISEKKGILLELLTPTMDILKKLSKDNEAIKLADSLHRKPRKPRTPNNDVNNNNFRSFQSKPTTLTDMKISSIKAMGNKELTEAIEYLEFEPEEKFNKTTLQMHYKESALKMHPDKRTNKNKADEEFKLLGKHHTYLKKLLL